jgi:hypothetical protein
MPLTRAVVLDPEYWRPVLFSPSRDMSRLGHRPERAGWAEHPDCGSANLPMKSEYGKIRNRSLV